MLAVRVLWGPEASYDPWPAKASRPVEPCPVVECPVNPLLPACDPVKSPAPTLPSLLRSRGFAVPCPVSPPAVPWLVVLCPVNPPVDECPTTSPAPTLPSLLRSRGFAVPCPVVLCPVSPPVDECWPVASRGSTLPSLLRSRGFAVPCPVVPECPVPVVLCKESLAVWSSGVVSTRLVTWQSVDEAYCEWCPCLCARRPSLY